MTATDVGPPADPADPADPPEPLQPLTLADSLTLSAARDTGMPGYRIVVPSPTSRPAPRPLRDRLPGLARLAALWAAMFIARMLTNALDPGFSEPRDVPVVEYLTWWGVWLTIALGVLLMFAGVARLARVAWARLRRR